MTVTKLVWAQTANYSAGTDAWSGLPTKIQPHSTLETFGYIPDAPAAAQHLNFVLNSLSANYTEAQLRRFTNYKKGAPLTTNYLLKNIDFDQIRRVWRGVSRHTGTGNIARCTFSVGGDFVEEIFPGTSVSSAPTGGIIVNDKYFCFVPGGVDIVEWDLSTNTSSTFGVVGSNSHVYSLPVLTANGTLLYGRTGEILRRNTAGVWSSISLPGATLGTDEIVVVCNQTTVFAFTHTATFKAWRSDDNGATFSALASTPPSAGLSEWVIGCVHHANGFLLYYTAPVGTPANYQSQGVFTTDFLTFTNPSAYYLPDNRIDQFPSVVDDRTLLFATYSKHTPGLGQIVLHDTDNGFYAVGVTSAGQFQANYKEGLGAIANSSSSLFMQPFGLIRPY